MVALPKENSVGICQSQWFIKAEPCTYVLSLQICPNSRTKKDTTSRIEKDGWVDVGLASLL